MLTLGWRQCVWLGGWPGLHPQHQVVKQLLLVLFICDAETAKPSLSG